MATPKIATCCYCGTRAALVLTGTNQHELACSSCGAPLHDLKQLPLKSLDGKHSFVKPSRVRVKSGDPIAGYKWDKKKKSKPKKKKKKSLGTWLLNELKDGIEDIFD
ncbi:MAG: hypothetical protein AAF386_08350 [Pseudomonadota bacterium]